MPGARKNRTKGNVKPSSSSRAAELLTQSGSTPTGFVGFQGLGGAHAYVPASQAFDDVDTCLDSDFRVVLRKLTKRDATTKIKALGEFSALCREKDDATLQAVLPFWPRLFNKMAIDTDAKVRECTQNAMANLVKRVRRNLAPFLKNVMGAWILSRNDTYPTVASAAHKSFSAAFPPDKQENAIVFCKQSVAEYMVDNLLNQTPSTLSDPKTTEKEEMESKYLRIQCSSLMGLRQLLMALPASQLDDGIKGHLRGLLNDGKFWNLSKSPMVLVRSGMYWFLGSLCQVVPEVAGEYVRKLSPLVLGSIDVLEPGLTGAVWDAVLSLIKFVPACWENINWQKAFWPKFRKLLESGCQGNAASVAPNLLPLLGCIPMETAGGAAVFLPILLDHFKQGFSKDCMANSPSETNAWAKAYMECLQFSFRQISSGDSSRDVLQAVLLDQLLPVVEASLFDPKPMLSRSPVYSSVSAFLRSLESKAETSSLAAAFWSQLSDDVVAMFATVGSGQEQSLRSDRLVSFVKALLFPPDTSGPVGVKNERVRFAADASKPQPRVPASTEVEMSDATKSFVKQVVVHSHKLYQQHQLCVHLKLFVDLANLYFPVDIATFVLQSIESNRESGSGEGTTGSEESATDSGKGTTDLREGTTDSGEATTDLREITTGSGESSADVHTRVIDKVVLPVLAGIEGGESREEVVDHTITLLFACLPYLSQKSSTDVWDNVLRSVSSTSALCTLIESALEKRHVMPQVSSWLSSPLLRSRLQDLVTMVTTKHSTMPPLELEQGLRVICLVLSANDDNEPVFPGSWIVDVVSSVHQELVTLGSRTLAPQEAQMAIHFVARAALTFFQNLRMSLCLNEGRDVIVALMMADLDTSFPTSGEADNMLRQSWTTGLGVGVQDTGGWMQEGGMLASACRVIQDTLLTKTQSMEQYKKVIEVTEELLKTTQSHLPTSDTEDGETCNPVLVALLSELMVPPCYPSVSHSSKIVQFLCLTGQLPLTVLDSLSARGADHSASMTRVVFSALFNLRLLHYHRTGLCFDVGEVTDENGEQGVLEGEEETVILNAVKALLLANIWTKVESQIPPDVVCAVDELRKTTQACFSTSSKSLQHQILDQAFARMNDDVVSALTVGELARMLSTRGNSETGYFQQLYSEKLESVDTNQEVLVCYLPSGKVSELFSLQAAMLASITADTLPSAISCLRVMGMCLTTEASEAIMIESADLLKLTLSSLKTMRDDHSDLFLFCCDISEEPLWRVAFNVSVMQFLTAAVNCDSCVLSPDLWDFILCSMVSWIESLDNSNFSLESSVSMQTFCVSVSHLLAAVARSIQQRLPLQRESYPPNLETEWKEFFAEGIYSFLFPLFVRSLDELRKSTNKGEAAVIVSAIGSAMSQCPQQQVMGHHLPLNLLASDDTSPIPDSLQTLLNYLCPALTCPLASAQVTAYSLLDKIITSLPAYHKEREAEGSTSVEVESRPPPAMLMKVIEDCATAMDVVLSPVAMETTVTMMPGSEEYQFALGYLLAWQLLLRLFHSAGSKGRAEYASFLKEHSNMERLLSHLFRLMPVSPGSGSASASPLKSTGSPLKRSLLETSIGDSWFDSSVISLTVDDVGQSEDIQRVSCCVYLHCLEVLPVLVRQWWKDQDRKSAAFVEKFTTKYVSPQLIKSEMQSVNHSESAIEDLIVKANSITRQVTASYTTEELKAEIQITLPESYPLGGITVDAQRHAVVKQAQWERLLLQLNVFLQHQNGSIMEGLRLWKRNIDKRIEGVEECFICYAVIHATSYDLPRVPCRTCKKKFHSSCLYKWLNSSQNATCPLCRSIF